MSEESDRARLNRTERLTNANRRNLQLIRQRPQRPRSVLRNDNGFVTWARPNEMRNVSHFNVYVDSDTNFYAQVPAKQVRMEGVFKDRVWVSSYNETAGSESIRVMAEEGFIIPNQQRLWLEIGGVTVRITNEEITGRTGIFVYTTDGKKDVTFIGPGQILILDTLSAGTKFFLDGKLGNDTDMRLYNKNSAERIQINAAEGGGQIKIRDGTNAILITLNGSTGEVNAEILSANNEIAKYAGAGGVKRWSIDNDGIRGFDASGDKVAQLSNNLSGGKLSLWDNNGANLTVEAIGNTGEVAALLLSAYTEIAKYAGAGGVKRWSIDNDGIRGFDASGDEVARLANNANGGKLTLQNADGAADTITLFGDVGEVALDSAGKVSVGGNQVVAARQAAVTTISATAGATYTATEQAMLNAIKASLNDLIAKLSSSSGHGLLT